MNGVAKKFMVLLVFDLLLTFLLSCNATKIVDEDYSKVTLLIWKEPVHGYVVVSELKDKKKINEVCELINEGQRKDLDSIIRERGPEGLLLFEKEGHKKELKVFTDSGDVDSEKYAISSGIDIKNFFDGNW